MSLRYLQMFNKLNKEICGYIPIEQNEKTKYFKNSSYDGLARRSQNVFRLSCSKGKIIARDHELLNRKENEILDPKNTYAIVL